MRQYMEPELASLWDDAREAAIRKLDCAPMALPAALPFTLDQLLGGLTLDELAETLAPPPAVPDTDLQNS